MEERSIYILFAKKPEAGKVKTRLAAEIGPEKAARLYEAFLKDILAALLGLHRPFAVAHVPEGSGDYFREATAGAAGVFPQRGRDLGERMENAFTRYFTLEYDKIILIGSDIPMLSPEILEEARAALTEFPAVLGPSGDGGYYLVGLREPVPGLFTGIAWGSDTVLQKTIAILHHRERGYHLLPELFDIDRAADLKELLTGLKSRVRGDNFIPEHTCKVLDELRNDARYS